MVSPKCNPEYGKHLKILLRRVCTKKRIYISDVKNFTLCISMVNIYFCYMKDWSLHGFSRKENCTLSIQTNKGLERKGHLHKGAHLKTHVCVKFFCSHTPLFVLSSFFICDHLLDFIIPSKLKIKGGCNCRLIHFKLKTPIIHHFEDFVV